MSLAYYSLSLIHVGFQLADIHVCVQWLNAFVSVINRMAQPVQKAFRGVSNMRV